MRRGCAAGSTRITGQEGPVAEVIQLFRRDRPPPSEQETSQGCDDADADDEEIEDLADLIAWLLLQSPD